MEECRLCKKEATLQLSHITPKFVGRFLKKTSAVGHIRNIVEPNKRVQDLVKDYLLCKECELRFSKYENQFAENIFYPFHNEKSEFLYKGWLKKFAISLNWRIGISSLNNSITPEHPYYNLLQDALEIWRKYLLDELPDPDPYEVHMYFLGLNSLENFSKVWSTIQHHHMNMRILRSVDFCVTVDEADRLFIYSNLTGITFISHIKPSSFENWTNQSKIKNIGTIKVLQKNTDPYFASFISQRLAKIDELIETRISDKQRDIVNQGITGDLNKAINSKSMGVLNEVLKELL